MTDETVVSATTVDAGAGDGKSATIAEVQQDASAAATASKTEDQVPKSLDASTPDELDGVIAVGISRWQDGDDSTSRFKVSALLGSKRDAAAYNPEQRKALAAVLTDFIRK